MEVVYPAYALSGVDIPILPAEVERAFTTEGYSVFDVLHAYEKACGKTLPYVIDPRRPGDIAACYADPTKAREELGWVAQYGIEEMCASSWKWQSANPDGYRS